MYQLAVLNQLAKDGEKRTRGHNHTCIPPSVISSPTPCFYTRCSITQIQGGPPKGLMDVAESHMERTGRVIGKQQQ